MKILYTWLKEFVDFPYLPEELADKLLELGFEIEEVVKVGDPLIIVGEVVEVKPHPRADRLKLCRVWTGKENLQIVCGAPNVKKGIKSPLALPGANLPGGKIEKRTIRGEESQGMLLSQRELETGEDAQGIWILPSSLKTGENLYQALSLEEWVLEVGITPNRGDCLSHLGIAREISAITGEKIKYPSIEFKEEEELEEWEVEVEDTSLCSRYTLRPITGIEIKESPLPIRWRLQLSGIRSINNVVDITNYVMLEMGQPLHAFDGERIGGKKIRVRKAKEGEKIVTLDGVERTLKEGDLVIADEEKPLALAGIMGGEESSVGINTSMVLLESAVFHPSVIRRTSRRLGLVSESSYRFERGVDEENTPRASHRASFLLQKYAEGRISKTFRDVKGEIPKKRVFLGKHKIARILGKDVENPDRLLLSLGFELTGTEEGWEVTVPTFRKDIKEEIDLIEEIARLHGYQSFPSTLPRGQTPPFHRENIEEGVRILRRLLVNAGLWEVSTYSFISLSFLERLGWEKPEESLKVSNPVSSDWEILRFSLIPGLIQVALFNLARGNRDLRFFEIGKIYMDRGKPYEEYSVGGILTGVWQRGGWMSRDIPSSLSHTRAIVEEISRVWKRNIQWEEKENPLFYPHLLLQEEGVLRGWMGTLKEEVREKIDLEQPVFVWEIYIHPWLKNLPPSPVFRGITPYPPVKRDLSLLVEERVPQGGIEEIIRREGGSILEDIYLFDLYRGKPVPPGFKSLTYSLTFRHPDKTLTDREIEKVMERIIQELERRGARIRGKE